MAKPSNVIDCLSWHCATPECVSYSHWSVKRPNRWWLVIPIFLVDVMQEIDSASYSIAEDLIRITIDTDFSLAVASRRRRHAILLGKGDPVCNGKAKHLQTNEVVLHTISDIIGIPIASI